MTTTSRKERFEFRITRELLAKVEAQARREGVSRAEIVTRAVEAYVTPYTPSSDLKAKIDNLISEINKLNAPIEEAKEFRDV